MSFGSNAEAIRANKRNALNKFIKSLKAKMSESDDDMDEEGDAQQRPTSSRRASSVEMINFVLDWIGRNVDSNQETNWTVAITAAPVMIISKVGGVTSKTGKMVDLADAIKAQPWWCDLEGVYLAKKFTADAASNHAEMCILAAADRLGQTVVDLKCASPNCEACAHMLDHAGVNRMNGMGSAQMGWSHPRGGMALGKQLGHPWDKQIAELDAFNQAGAPDTFKHVYTQRVSSKPAGGYEDLD